LASNVQPTKATRVEMLPVLRRHWFVALFPVVVFVAGAIVLGLARPVNYTSTATLSVGHVYVSNPAGIPSIIEATRSLASAYSRAVDSNVVRADTRQRLGERSDRVSGSLSATPIPESPLIKVSAKSSSAGGAVALANAGSAALAAYINRQVRDSDATGLLSERYRRAALHFRQLIDAQNRARRRYERDKTTENKAARDRAAAAADTGLLRREALRVSYQTAVQGGSSSVGVEVFSTASTPTNDRRTMLQLLVFVGLLGGLAAGAALALLLASREVRRRPV
jgi:uncharacterized protein involved in exopolysaccharide biosynthesis